ncbi:GAF domain-containing protein [Tumidithrix elongata RA019]|uniref:histidine kinase n=1 Tax=Tumidithrix elongata BACA0141 TaxID=2716417 RepID=A0AAW9PYL3_9CYAN|nr:GAF domain-containing protein [Tumidithrix elongata RA019]
MSQQIDELLNHAPCGFLSFTDDGAIALVNLTLSELLGYPRDFLAGKMLDVILPIASRIFYQTHFFPLLKLHGKVEEIYFSLRAKSGNDIPMLINAERRQQGETFVNNCIFIPIRQRIQYEDEILKAKKAAEAAALAQKQAEIALREQYDRAILLSGITQRIRDSLNLATIFEISTQEIRQSIHADRVGIFKFQPDSNFNDGEFVCESVADGFDSAIAIKIHDRCFGEQYAPFYQQGRIQAVDDIYHAGLTECHRDILQRFQVQANLVVPLLKGAHLWGLLCIHQCSAPRQWQAVEIDFIQQIANQLTIAIQQANLFNQLQAELVERQKAEDRMVEANAQLSMANLELQRTSAQLEATNQELESFSYSVSHDLRAPLRAITGFSQILLEDYGDRFDDDCKDYFDRISRNIHRMEALIDDLLRLSRISRAEINYGKVDLSEMVREIAGDLQASQPQRVVEFLIEPKAIAYTDRNLTLVVLENLLQNAWKYTNRHATARIEFGMATDIHQTLGQTTYFLRDDGAGFNMENSSKLFGAFQRLHSASEFPGTGIGLATVQRVIRRHGGKIWAEAAIEQGATFYFTLPDPP